MCTLETIMLFVTLICFIYSMLPKHKIEASLSDLIRSRKKPIVNSGYENRVIDIVYERGGGIKKRIDENRELLEELLKHAPELLKSNPWIVWWIKCNDETFCGLRDLMYENNSWLQDRLGDANPRDWPEIPNQNSKSE